MKVSFLIGEVDHQALGGVLDMAGEIAEAVDAGDIGEIQPVGASAEIADGVAAGVGGEDEVIGGACACQAAGTRARPIISRSRSAVIGLCISG